MNSVCNELARFLSSSQEYCARWAGFESKAAYLAEKNTRWQEADNYDICMLQRYYRNEQNERVRAVLSRGNPKSFVSVFSRETLKQAWGLIAQYLKKRVKEAAKQPPYESPSPQR